MKVLHIVPQLFGADGIYGGAERYALELGIAMAERTPTRLVGFGVPRYPGSGWERRQRLAIYTLRNRLPGRRFEGSPASVGLLRHLRWADVVHCHQTYTMATSLALLHAHARGKLVFTTDHAGGGPCLQSYFNIDAWFSGHLWVSRFSRGSNPIRDGDDIVWGGADTRRFCPDPEVAPSGEVLFVGRLLPVKGVHHLLQAVDATTPVTLFGATDASEYVRQLHRAARGKHVSFLPPTDGEALVRAYQRALCVVLPGVEMFALTCLEAMACATPVICTASSGMTELIEDGVHGFIVPHGDTAALGERIAWLQAHPGQARTMGAAARRRVCAGFTWDAVADRCFRAYCAVAAVTGVGSSSRHSSAASSSTR